MCNLAEYIVARRAMHIVCCLSNPDCEEAQEAGKYRSFFMSGIDSVQGNGSLIETAHGEEAINIQQRLQDVFTLCIEGSTLKRFLGVNTTSENAEPETIPVFLLEVFEPSHAWIPIYITNRSVLMVSPFRNPMLERIGGSPYVYELFPISLLREAKTFADINKALFEPFLEGDNNLQTSQMEFIDSGVNPEEATKPNNPSYADVIHEAINLFACGIQNSDKMLSLGNTELSSGLVSPVGMESVELKKLKATYGAESIQHFENASEDTDGIIGKADYMPIYVSDGENYGPAVYTKSEDEGVLKITFKPRIGGYINKPEEIVGILTKENLKYGKIYIIELDCNCYYAGKCQIGCCDECGEAKFEPLFSYMYSEGDEIAAAEEENGIGTESAIQSVSKMGKAFINICKKFGIKSGSQAYTTMKIFLKLPTKFAKWIYNTLMSIFRTGNELEKMEAIELQEKLLNDELDKTFEWIKMCSEIHIKALGLSALFGAFWTIPFTWLFQRARTKKAKQKAIERLELKLDEAMDRLKRKINHAEERSENEDEDKLMKELELYKLAKMKLLEIKQESFGGKRIKYATFDKDLSMTASQRIDSLLRGSGNPDY